MSDDTPTLESLPLDVLARILSLAAVADRVSVEAMCRVVAHASATSTTLRLAAERCWAERMIALFPAGSLRGPEGNAEKAWMAFERPSDWRGALEAISNTLRSGSPSWLRATEPWRDNSFNTLPRRCSMGSEGLPVLRRKVFAHTACLHHGKLYVFGGRHLGTHSNHLEMCDLSKTPLKWVEVPQAGTPPHPRRQHTAVVDSRSRMHIVGGGFLGGGGERVYWADHHLLDLSQTSSPASASGGSSAAANDPPARWSAGPRPARGWACMAHTCVVVNGCGMGRIAPGTPEAAALDAGNFDDAIGVNLDVEEVNALGAGQAHFPLGVQADAAAPFWEAMGQELPPPGLGQGQLQAQELDANNNPVMVDVAAAAAAELAAAAQQQAELPLVVDVTDDNAHELRSSTTAARTLPSSSSNNDDGSGGGSRGYGESLLVFGGLTTVWQEFVGFAPEPIHVEMPKVSSSLLRYDIDNNYWHTIAPYGTPPVARFRHTACVLPHRQAMVVWGGFTVWPIHIEGGNVVAPGWDERCSNDVFLLDLPTLTWSQPVTRGETPDARGGHSAAVIGDHLLIVGGCDGGPDNENAQVRHQPCTPPSPPAHQPSSSKRTLPSHTLLSDNSSPFTPLLHRSDSSRGI